MILFSRRPPLSDQPLPMPSYSPSSIRGRAIERAPQTPGFYSRLFVVQDSGSGRPIIDLSTLNTFIVSQQVFYEAYGSNIRHSPSLRYQDPPIPRRLVNSKRIKDHMYSCEGQAPAPMRGAGTTSEPQKVITVPISGHDLTRNGNSVSSVHCKTNRDKNREPPRDNRGVSLVPKSPSIYIPTSWAIQQQQGVDLSLPVPDLSLCSDDSDVGWGGDNGGPTSVRRVDSMPKPTVHQPQGDDGST